jgi:hypothetical protein
MDTRFRLWEPVWRSCVRIAVFGRRLEMEMTRHWIRRLLSVVLLVLLAAFQAPHNSAASPDRLVVHEWGTFTSVAGDDGLAVEWRPLNGAKDLPGFVYDASGSSSSGLRNPGRCIKCSIEALERMETPVIYFYSQTPRTVSVRVEFRGGRITEWYPQARSVFHIDDRGDGVLDWGFVKIRPGTDPAFPVEAGENHYYSARETDAAPVRVCGSSGKQQEKFLFYRGLGTFDVPLNARLDGDKVVINNAGNEQISEVILFENQGGRAGYVIHDLFGGRVELDRPRLDQPVDSLLHELQTVLVAHGLYEKEARAMVKTWRDSWFEEGIRVFYIVARKTVDQVLPLSIEPAPDELVRVLVGRVEVITPEVEDQVRTRIANAGGSAAELRRVARDLVAERGRFAEPILKRVLLRTEDPVFAARVQQVIAAAKVRRDQPSRPVATAPGGSRVLTRR